MEVNKTLKQGKSSHHLSLGVFGKYEANLGKGKIFDAEHPFYDGGQGGRGDRSYKFRNRIRILQYGGYLQDKLSLPIGRNMLSITGGLRLEAQRERLVVSPRINGLFLMDNGLSFNAAYGISYKIPATAYLYPENVYFDRLVFSNYSDNSNERLYLYQTKVIDPTNHNLKSPYDKLYEDRHARYHLENDTRHDVCSKLQEDRAGTFGASHLCPRRRLAADNGFLLHAGELAVQSQLRR